MEKGSGSPEERDRWACLYPEGKDVYKERLHALLMGLGFSDVEKMSEMPAIHLLCFGRAVKEGIIRCSGEPVR